MRTPPRPLRLFFSLAVLIAPLATAQTVRDTEWPSYGNDAGGSHYSPVSQIDRTNVSRLREVWTYHTGALTPETELNEKAAFEATPLLFGGKLYVITPFNRVIALDPGTGRELWTFDPKVDRDHGYSEVTSRGVSVWKGKETGRPCATRLFFGTLDARLMSIDAADGKPCNSFGGNGEIDLTIDVHPATRHDYEVTSPPAIIGDLVVVGSSIGDNSDVNVGRGIVRAYDVRTGTLRWSFDPLAKLAKTSTAGAANAWAVISADIARGLIFVPTSSPSPDYYGGMRPGSNGYANSVVALRAATGEVVWSFQVVHHDLWDYDIASQPMLIEAMRNGKRVPAVAVTTKMGFLFVLERLTGKPVFPVEERAVPKSDIKGEDASATQPFPTTAALTSMTLSAADAWGVTDEDRDFCAHWISSLRNEGIFTPPSTRGTLVYPSNVGGVAWGGASWDKRRNLLLVNVNRLPVAVRLVPSDEFDAQKKTARANRVQGDFEPQRGAPYGMYRSVMFSSHHLPCIAPPWGTLVAIDLTDGSKKWEVPLGGKTIPAGAAGNKEAVTIAGLPGFGGTLTTAGGLTFIASTIFEDALRAFDTDSGKKVWEIRLPAGGQSTPMTYVYHGRQYVVLSAGGHGKAGTTMGDSVIAYALP